MATGRTLNRAISRIIKTNGQKVVIYNNWNTDSQTSFETIGMKSKDYFLFTEQLDIQRDSVIQVKNGRDYWRVLDTEEEFAGNALLSFKVFVVKIDAQGLETRPSSQQPSAVFHGDFIGAFQQGGSQNTQTVNIQINQKFDDAFNQVLKAIQDDKHLDEDLKEDAIEALQKLPGLAQREQTESVMKRAKEKLDVVNSAISTSKELALIAAPYLIELAKYFHFSG
jgi:hypothetical protein